jgi:hypothetical protein
VIDQLKADAATLLILTRLPVCLKKMRPLLQVAVATAVDAAANGMRTSALVSSGKAKVSGNVVQRHEHGKPGDFSHLNDEELKESLYDVTKELAELDPEFAEFAKQLAQQKRATTH